jgi:hypothetical protein
MFVFPMMVAPRERSWRTIVASKGEAWEARMREAHCVGRSVVAMLSFTARRKGFVELVVEDVAAVVVSERASLVARSTKWL